MVVSKPAGPFDTVFSAGDELRHGKHPDALEVIGPYDVIVPINGSSLEDIYAQSKEIAHLDTVANSTTYVSVWSNAKSSGPARCCILMEVDLARHEKAPQKILALEHVLRVDVILGPFDLVVLADVGLDGLHDFLAEIVRVEGVMRSLTMYEIKRT